MQLEKKTQFLEMMTFHQDSPGERSHREHDFLMLPLLAFFTLG